MPIVRPDNEAYRQALRQLLNQAQQPQAVPEPAPRDLDIQIDPRPVPGDPNIQIDPRIPPVYRFFNQANPPEQGNPGEPPNNWQEFVPIAPRPIEPLRPVRPMWNFDADENEDEIFRDDEDRDDERIDLDIDGEPQPVMTMKVPIGEVFYNQKLSDFIPSQLRGKKQDGEIGIEIECEGSRLFREPLSWWVCHQDGSLREDREGNPPVEYVLRNPISRKEVPEALNYLSKKLAQSKSKVEDSHRTSVHVHFNVQQMTLKEIFTFICLYLIFENSLVEFSGPDRIGNLFCQRAKDAQFWVFTICRAFQSGDFRSVFSENFRYTSCNTASISKFGSLEFRSMRGTVDDKLIQNWVNLLCLIKDKASGFKDPFQLFTKFVDMSRMDFFNFVFKEQPNLGRLLNSTTLAENMQQGSIFVRDIAYSVEEWIDKTPTEKKRVKKRPRAFNEADRELEEVPQPAVDPAPAPAPPAPRPRRTDREIRAMRNPGRYSFTRIDPDQAVMFVTPWGNSVALRVNRRAFFDEFGIISTWNIETQERVEWFTER